MEYILSGNPADVENVIKENRIRVARGVIKFTPVTTADAPDNDTKEVLVEDTKEVLVEDTKDAPVADVKKPKNAKK